MRPCNSISLAISTIAIDALDCIISLTISAWAARINPSIEEWHSKWLLHTSSRLTLRKEVIAMCWIRLTAVRWKIRTHQSTREVFCDLDLDITKISLPSGSLSLLLVRVVGFRGSWRSSLEPTVPIMRDEGFTLVFLGRSVRVDIVDVGKVCLEPGRVSQ